MRRQQSQVGQFVFDVVEQILGISDKLAVRFEIEASAKRVGGTPVEIPGLQRHLSGWAARDLVRRELVAPAERIPESGVLGPERDRAIDEREAVNVSALPGNQCRRKMLDRLDVVRIEIERLSGECDARRGIVRGLTLLCFGEERPCRRMRVAQCIASTNFSASSSVKTRNEFVRTLPWLLTASETRVIVSSSGASAMTT